MYPVKFNEFNKVLTPPEGMDNCIPLHVFNDGVASVSCWQPTPEELEEINRTGCVWVIVYSGQSAPPISVTGNYPFARVEVPTPDITNEGDGEPESEEPEISDPILPPGMPTDPEMRKQWITAFNRRTPRRQN